MESGQLEVRVRDFALGPLLQVMRHNFGILAESRGLRLSAVDTRCVVRSDEALLRRDRKSTRLNSSHLVISYAVFCLKKKKPHDHVRGATLRCASLLRVESIPGQ